MHGDKGAEIRREGPGKASEEAGWTGGPGEVGVRELRGVVGVEPQGELA